jgi:hypothetical protein
MAMGLNPTRNRENPRTVCPGKVRKRADSLSEVGGRGYQNELLLWSPYLRLAVHLPDDLEA